MANHQNSKNWTPKKSKDKPKKEFNQPNNSNTEPLMVKSPYNFVPAPEANEVFTPDWAEKVLHDMPLSADAESGEISYTITAESPIFIRNGHSKKDHEVFEKWRDNKETEDFELNEEEKVRLDRYLSFSNYNGKYFIPATSIKGMLRNVLEIMSFSRLNPNLVNDHRYGYRDLSNGSDYMKNYKSPAVKAGWLSKTENG